MTFQMRHDELTPTVILFTNALQINKNEAFTDRIYWRRT
jgi:hypothetical protein